MTSVRAMDPFVQQLAELCRTHVTRTKWVIVPSHAAGRTIGERVALGGTNWVNLRFVTPLDLAVRMGAPFLVERGIDPSEEGLGPALMMRLLLELPVRDGYFRPLAEHPTLAQALWSAVRELRMAGVRSSDLPPGAFRSSHKHAELRALLAKYEAFLDSTNRADMASVYEEALRHPDWCPVGPADLRTELPLVVWSPLQQTLLDALPGERVVPRALAIPGGVTPRRLAGKDTAWVVAPRAELPLAHLSSPAHPAPAVELFHAGGREAEIEEVFRRILSSGAPLDHVEIACAAEAHVSLVWEKALRHDWPVTLGPGIPATQTRPGRALIGLCDWIETDFSAGYFRRLLQSGDLGLELEDEGFTATQAARVLARAEAGWGRATYGLALGRLRREYDARAADPDESDDDRGYASERSALTAKVAHWITGLSGSIPEPDAAGLVPLVKVVDAAITFVERTTARKSALDHRAAAALAGHVTGLRPLGTFACTLPQALRFLRERAAGLQVAPERPRPGHLFVSSLSHACLSGRPHLFVVGLEEGRVFPAATEDAVLLDEEREAISPALRRSADSVDESVHAVLSRLATWRADGGVATFSYSCRDTREFRETYASWLMLHAFRLRQGDPAATYQQMKAALGEPKSLVPSDRAAAPSPGAWWLRSVAGTGDAGRALVDARFPSLAEGRRAGAERASGEFTRYDGYVPDAAGPLDPCAEDVVFSVTELEAAANCPFRFFLKRGLGIRVAGERDRDRDVWLDPLTRGAELHDLYAAALRRCRDEGRGVDLTTDGPWLRAQAERRLLSLQEEMPPATKEIFEREWNDFLADLDLFLELEAGRAPGTTPIAFEVSFGRPLDDGDEPLASARPVAVDLGGGLEFHVSGRIDRIDQVGPSTFEVIDYKTGGFWRDEWGGGVFRGGRRLQHALYGLAAVQLLKSRVRAPKVSAGVYYFSSHKGRGERRRIEAPSVASTSSVLGDLRATILDGAFAHAREEEDCRFCDYKAGCDGALTPRAAAKLGHARLKAYDRLAAHD
jgi:RecB family exonuclease